MTNKTRIRVARIAAGAVIAAGASLTAAGVAIADETDCDLLDICVSPSPTQTTPSTPPTAQPTATETVPSTPPVTNIPTGGPPLPTGNPTLTTQPDNPTADPSESSDDDTTAPGTGGGGDNTDPDGGSGPSTQDEGSSSLTDTGTEIPAADTSAQGGGDELAETGAAQTTFLLIGAATMIAGGVAFRVLPRVMGGRGGAAA
ncbi:LPXTG cell wall anchor domain-containing protein [Streptomyces sp. TRM70350]|uniref:LPXTG cell wall anchor domain-containing protein n=1 Tax=Streptomyces sp. TRM70350 TaxID=2856165 RepID=UPI001C44E879|nr:LPXTG cell wall anchor domain-containing protein [Streptomyces sp. TRM70350]MBV7698964.1 LPXTG cell wall anchor domain-containing protein [Streptomyces sp. TRM70350]